uniref:Uncharacterized protein n=2 Tax=viral metagenome TaxID=1070528 RepID=A0A6M3KVN3_9ZZZZ
MKRLVFNVFIGSLLLLGLFCFNAYGLSPPSFTSAGGDVSEDTSPSLGGNLDMAGFELTDTTDGVINFASGVSTFAPGSGVTVSPLGPVVFGNLATKATRAIDLSGTGFTTASQNHIYIDDNNRWDGVGFLRASYLYSSDASGYIRVASGALLYGGSVNNGSPHKIELDTLKPMLFGDYGSSGSVADATVTSGSAYLYLPGHGISNVTGYMIIVYDSASTADEKIMRVTGSDYSGVTVSETFVASGTTTDAVIYGNAIGFMANDGTNGNWIAGFTNQKPLQIGGSSLVATTHSLTTGDVLIANMMEVKSSLYLDGITYHYNNVTFQDNKTFYMGTDNDISLKYDGTNNISRFDIGRVASRPFYIEDTTSGTTPIIISKSGVTMEGMAAFTSGTTVFFNRSLKYGIWLNPANNTLYKRDAAGTAAL